MRSLELMLLFGVQLLLCSTGQPFGPETCLANGDHGEATRPCICGTQLQGATEDI